MAVVTHYLVTGASRGIGHGVVKTFLARPNNVVIAAVRTPSTAAPKLEALPRGENTKLIVVKLDSTVQQDAFDAVKELKQKHGVQKLDTILANAGIGTHYGPVKDVSADKFLEHITTNTIGPLTLFQATHELLVKSKQPKFAIIGSMQGSIGGMENYPFPMGAYGASKAAAHYIIRKIHYEHEKEGIVAWAMDPGFVQTDTGNTGAQFFGMKEAPNTIKESVEFITKTIDGATRETMSGHFPSLSGSEIEW